jgi:DNA (cytosine-5)-methyltransferase 1
VGVRDQVMDLVAGQGLKVSRQSDNLLPTPDAYSADCGGSQNPTKRRAGGHQVTLADEAEKGEEVTLLPTPVTTDAAGARNATANRSNPDSRHHSGTTLTDALLPTVTASLVASGGSSSPNWKRNRGSQVTLKDEIEKGDDVKNLTLLPTPSVAHLRNHDEDIDGYLERRQDFIDGKTLGMPGASLGVAVRMQAEGIDLLPTPQTMDTLPARSGQARERQLRRGGEGSRRAASGNLREDIIELLPTTSARDFKDGQADHERNGKVQTDTVARQIFSGGEITSTAWGKFAPAIGRWEQLTGRAAPAPTKPDGKDDAHRLSSEFTEWMMGLPAGWITGVGLSRNEELKACGNGVVPQQAELALRNLLDGVNLAV